MLVYYIRKIFCAYGVYICILIFSARCAYFNTFYNAEQSFSKAVKIIQNAPILEDNKLPSESVTLLNKVISDCDRVIDNYPDSKYLDNAYLLKGVSYFYKKSYDSSVDNLAILLNDNQSVYYRQAVLWSAYSFLRLKDSEKSSYYLNKIKAKNLNDEDLYVYYNIKAELSESIADMENAYKYYILASDITSNDFRKIYIYRKLIYLSELSDDILSKNKFIELLEPYIENLTELRNLKIEWIEGKRQVNQFEEVIEEIDNIIDQNDFQSIKPKLMLYKSKAYQQLNRAKPSKDILNDIISEYSKKDETSEAYYILGNLALFDEFDLDKTKEYYQKSIDEKSRSEHAKKAKSLKGKIEKYEKLVEDIDYFSSNSSIDTTLLDFESNGMDIPLPEAIGEVQIDSLLFEIGQIFYFDFNQIDSAMTRYQYILDNFPNSTYTSQVSNILEFNQDPSLFLENVDLSYIDNNLLISRRDNAWSLNDMTEQRDYYKSLYSDYGDSIALFNIAYIEDLFLYNTKEAVSIYNKIKSDYSTHPNINHINDRLSSIQVTVNTLIKEKSFLLRFNDALELLNSYQLDSARTILENIVLSRKSSSYQTVNTLIMQIDIYKDLNENYIQKASDSLIYKMGELEYSYFYNDLGSEKKMKQIINDFPNSDYKMQAVWLLNEKLKANTFHTIDSLDYLSIDTSIIRVANPVDGIDMKKIRLDSIKLEHILLDFEESQ